MFTGIVQGTATVKTLLNMNGMCQLTITFPEDSLIDLTIGASIAIEGCCLTVVSISDHDVRFDVIQETLARTMYHAIAIGDAVNFERSARFGDEIGGHLVSGHIHDTVEIIALDQPPLPRIVTFQTTPQWIHYIFSKGFITLSGTSLTVVDCDRENATFSVHLIPETWERTTWKDRQVGDRVNLEIDQMTLTIVDTTEQFLKMGLVHTN